MIPTTTMAAVSQGTEGVFLEKVEDLAGALWLSLGQQANATLQTWLMAEAMIREITYSAGATGVSLHQIICERAYVLWEAAGYQHGRALDFWLAAERGVWDQLARPTSPSKAGGAAPPPGFPL